MDVNVADMMQIILKRSNVYDYHMFLASYELH